jgi:hypothetical protein
MKEKFFGKQGLGGLMAKGNLDSMKDGMIDKLKVGPLKVKDSDSVLM